VSSVDPSRSRDRGSRPRRKKSSDLVTPARMPSETPTRVCGSIAPRSGSGVLPFGRATSGKWNEKVSHVAKKALALADREPGLREELGLPEPLGHGLVGENSWWVYVPPSVLSQNRDLLGEIELGLDGDLAHGPVAVAGEARTALRAHVARQASG